MSSIDMKRTLPLLFVLLLSGCIIKTQPPLVVKHNIKSYIPLVPVEENPQPGKILLGGMLSSGERATDSTEYYYYQEEFYIDYCPYLSPASTWYVKYGLNKLLSLMGGYDETGYTGDLILHIREREPHAAISIGALFNDRRTAYPRISLSFSAPLVEKQENIRIFAAGAFTYFPVYVDFSQHSQDSLDNEYYYEIKDIYKGNATLTTIGIEWYTDNIGISIGYNFIFGIKEKGVRMIARDKPPQLISLDSPHKARFRGGVYFKF